MDSGGLHCVDLIFRTAFTARDNRTRVAHSATRRRRAAGDEADTAQVDRATVVGAAVYFGLSCVLLGLCLVAFLVLERLPYTRARIRLNARAAARAVAQRETDAAPGTRSNGGSAHSTMNDASGAGGSSSGGDDGVSEWLLTAWAPTLSRLCGDASLHRALGLPRLPWRRPQSGMAVMMCEPRYVYCATFRGDVNMSRKTKRRFDGVFGVFVHT